METNKIQLQKKKKRRLVLIVVLAAVAVLLAAGLAIRSWIRMPDVPDDPAKIPEQGQGDIQNKPAGDRKEGVYTFLVAGKDVASGSTDTMLLLTYDIKTKTVNGLNLPRDTMMNVSTSGKRLNAIFSYNRGKDKATQTQNGMAALKRAVADLTGIAPDFYVLVEWEAIGELVDAIGGVEFEVPFDMDYDDPYQDPPLHIHQKAGLRTLTGDDAMEVIRWRKNNDGSGGEGGDIARLSIQQDFLKAVVKKCLQPAIVLKFNSLVEIFKENVETDLTVGNILAFAEQAVGMNPDTGVSFTTAPLADSFKYNKAALVTLDPDGLLEIINSKMNPYHKDITVDELELVVRLSNGTFTVTSGELAEGINDFVRQPVPQPKPEPEPIPEPEQPAQGESPDEGEPPVEGEMTEPEQPAEGEAPEEGEIIEPEAPVEGEIIQPEQPVEGESPGENEPAGAETPVGGEGVTEPEQPAPETAEPVQAPESVPDPIPEPVQEQNVTENVAILPPWPMPVEQVA